MSSVSTPLLLSLWLVLWLLLLGLSLALVRVLSQNDKLLFELPLEKASGSPVSLTQIKLLQKMTVFSDSISVGERFDLATSCFG
jgi:hypothetical protein